MTASSVLLVSNGFGEAAIAGYIARELVRIQPESGVEHFRMVGKDPANAWPPPVGPQADMPSGGLVAYGNARDVAADLRAGLIGLAFRQFGFLRRQRHRSVVVAVGDVYCLAACRMFARRPTIFVATAKSEYVAGHSRLECWIARGAEMTFARDQPTADALAARGVRASFAGNLMMDGVARPAAGTLPVDAGALRIGVLPGSRRDAAGNAGDAVRRLRMIAAAVAPSGVRVQAFVSVAEAAAPDAITSAIAAQDIHIERTGAQTGVIARGRGDESNLDVVLVRGSFAELLAAVDVVFGQAGTANEQAAGLGKPVIAASEPGKAPQRAGWYRQRQQRLLGDALLVLPGDDRAFVDGALHLIDDPLRRERMAAAGRERMDGAGGAAVVADAALTLSERRAP